MDLSIKSPVPAKTGTGQCVNQYGLNGNARLPIGVTSHCFTVQWYDVSLLASYLPRIARLRGFFPV